MPTLINDWDSAKRQPTVRYGVRCDRCGRAEKSDTLGLPKGWEETKVPNFNGRFPAQCPDCRTS